MLNVASFWPWPAIKAGCAALGRSNVLLVSFAVNLMLHELLALRRAVADDWHGVRGAREAAAAARVVQ